MLDSIYYPVITFDKFSFHIIESEEKLTITTSAGLNNGLYTNLIIIDSKSDFFKVRKAQKMFGIGLFWGYNIFLNQKIKVSLDFEEKTYQEPLSKIKERVLMYLNKDHFFWNSGGNLGELKEIVNKATTTKELIVHLGTVVNKQYK